jgi:hypothetical protein
MKLCLPIILLLIAGCAPAQPYRPGAATPSGTTASGTATGSVTGQTVPASSYSQDAVDCERQAAVASIGSKGEAFSKCMRARGHTPGR